MIRLVAAAKGLAVGVLTLAISVAGTYAYGTWRSSVCPFEEGGIVQHPGCNQELAGLGVLFEGVVVLFALLLALGPLLARAFRLPHPAHYMIPPFLAVLFACLVLRQHVGLNALVPFAAYPVIAALNAGGRDKAPDHAPSPDSPASPG